ncbi:hypothetical protein CA54_38550 [Symmachiella macrocystis]|uniref:DUF2924 domain-containing protein n=1 Tax=Symmachiella macrocystis TaxID=2527985 RepID=A0A5C6BB02_9PLAN|nr:DUF2924 domain-containing protein [Symmachiella macrocystis]TWU08621.1 hypothetical protein CA54_38550 [Symmachiella macrocystis]
MSLSIGQEVATLRKMTVKELRVKYAELFDDETRTGNKAWLIKRIAWRMQAQAEGGLSKRARQRADELANEADLRMSPPKLTPESPSPSELTTTSTVTFSRDQRLPLPGTVLTREYKGQTVQVRVLEHGFEHDGQVYRSLIAVAKAITGTHTNGYLFFRLRKEARR